VFSFLAIEKSINASTNIPSSQKAAALQRYRDASADKSNAECQDIAADVLGERVDWDWDRKLFRLETLFVVLSLLSLMADYYDRI